jgi:hypothetical protein
MISTIGRQRTKLLISFVYIKDLPAKSVFMKSFLADVKNQLKNWNYEKLLSVKIKE